VIGAFTLLAAVVPSIIEAIDREPASCSSLISELDRLSPQLKDIYAAPGDPPPNVPQLAAPDELEEWGECGGDPEALLEEAARP
jgi:hypothetical protein